MRVLEIAEPHGKRHDHQKDFHFATVGELAITPFACDNPTCGCTWSWSGLDSALSSTAARVAERDTSHGALVQEIADKLRPRWPSLSEREIQATARQEVAAMRQVAEVFELGEVLERNRSTTRARKEQA